MIKELNVLSTLRNLQLPPSWKIKWLAMSLALSFNRLWLVSSLRVARPSPRSPFGQMASHLQNNGHALPFDTSGPNSHFVAVTH